MGGGLERERPGGREQGVAEAGGRPHPPPQQLLPSLELGGEVQL